MAAKTSQLQIRISPAQKAVLKRLAAAEEMSVSAYVLSRVLPSHRVELAEKVDALAGDASLDEALGELVSYLRGLPDEAFLEATTGSEPGHLAPVLQNYAAAAVEWDADRRGVTPPRWTSRVEPLQEPHFAWDLRSLRPYLMRVTPAAYKRRRLFVSPRDDLGS